MLVSSSGRPGRPHPKGASWAPRLKHQLSFCQLLTDCTHPHGVLHGVSYCPRFNESVGESANDSTHQNSNMIADLTHPRLLVAHVVERHIKGSNSRRKPKNKLWLMAPIYGDSGDGLWHWV